MPVYNALPFLDESIRSILEQTLSDFEFVILDDASTDGSVERLREWSPRDGRIRLHESRQRLGLSGSSNAVVAKARAPIVARMDADDIAHPDRLRRQWNIMESRLGGYDEKSGGGEDQDLFQRMSARGRVVTLPDVLYSYRYHSRNVTLFNGTRAVAENHSHNGDALAAFYMLGAMRLWAGDPPMLLEPMLQKTSLKWNLKTLMILAAAVVGHVSPSALRVFLRSSIRARDLLAGVRVKDGRPCEWRWE